MAAGSQDDRAGESERVRRTDAGERVRMTRTLTRDDEGVFATYSLETDGDRPVKVEVVDLLPSRWDSLEFVGVHPEFEPAESSASRTQILFRAEIPPEEDRIIKYGIKGEEAVSRSLLIMARQSRFPQFAMVEPLEAEDRAENDTKEDADAPLVRGQTRTVPDALQSKEAFQEAKRQLFGTASQEESTETTTNPEMSDLR